ncbi:MAG: ATP-binding protein [Nitrospira sp.]|nr:ATP-binding protein [Planctomycetota bacterium]MCK6498051.1 ATP-binding protein [Nitrospira sp.]
MSRMPKKVPFHFDISLSVLNHLGRKLYRSFMTVLGEAVSNAWDADATNVWIYLDINKNTMVIKDDGQGMSRDDFQDKFLKIGYSKRKEASRSPKRKRPFIGRKGIGKLALLSCAERTTVVSKVRGEQYVGGVIDNSGLDKAITDDLTPNEYPLQDWNRAALKPYMRGHQQGTIIFFERINDGVRHTLGFLKKSIALYFRFSLLDKNFNIHLNGEKITTSCLDDLAMKTEFLWEINEIRDPYVAHLRRISTPERNDYRKLKVKGDIKGFIASVEKPRDLKITTTDERVGVDLFVNGRLREKDILKHMPTARVVESYLYGQVHCDLLDDKVDRFTSSRESMVADDPKFAKVIKLLKTRILNEILNDWDSWRRKHKEEGDVENLSITRKERKAEELYNVVAEEYAIKDEDKSAKPIDTWVTELGEDARFNFGSYAECFISENLIRRFITETKTPLSDEAKKAIEIYRRREKDSKDRGNISIELRKSNTKLSYLAMDDLANLVDKRDKAKEACLARDAAEYKPIRDAMAHTALLADGAKTKLTTVHENIKGRLRTLFSTFRERK